VQGLHIEVRLDARLDARHRDLDLVAADARDDAASLDPLDRLGQHAHASLLDAGVTDAAVDERTDGAVVDRLVDLAEIVRADLELGDPLDRTAPLVPVATQDSLAVIVEPEDGGVDAHLLAQGERLHHLVVGEVGLQQRRDVEQVAAVGEAADQVAAGEHPADRHLADPTRRHAVSRR